MPNAVVPPGGNWPPTNQTLSGLFAQMPSISGNAPTESISVHQGPLIVPVQRVRGSPAHAEPPPAPAAPDPAAPPAPAMGPAPAVPAPAAPPAPAIVPVPPAPPAPARPVALG